MIKINIYFDTEFTGLQKDTNLISIGLISETGEEFYAEFSSINTEVLDSWIRNNVLNNTVKYGNLQVTDLVLDETNYHFGTKEEIRVELEAWLKQYNDVQLISDVCHYDMVLFIDIFGTAFDIPSIVNPYCYDINNDIALYCDISYKEAFNLNREDFLSEEGIDIKGVKHNSLYDAKVIKEIYELCNNINYNYIKV